MADEMDEPTVAIMSPRQLPNSVQVAPGRYVSDDIQQERDMYNEIWRGIGRNVFAVNLDKIIRE